MKCISHLFRIMQMDRMLFGVIILTSLRYKE